MADAQELQIQQPLQAQVQAQAQAHPQPGHVAPAFANEDTSSSCHGPLPAVVSSSNLPDPSVLDSRSPSQPSQAPAECETHTQSSSTIHGQARAHVKRPQDLQHQHLVEKPRPEELDPETNSRQALHGATEAVGGKEAEKDIITPAADATRSALTTFTSSPLPASDSTSTTAATATATATATNPSTVPSDPSPSTTISTLTTTPKPTLTNGAPTEAHGQQIPTGSAPLSPSPAAIMSNPPQYPGHTRPPVGFPSPTYASQGMYGYGSPPGDPYRGPPGAHQPMSLPSMRTFDPVQQQQAQQAPMAQQMMQVQATMPPYYAHPVPLAGNPYSLPPDAMGSRYALPPNDPRFLQNPRNKKSLEWILYLAPSLSLDDRLTRATEKRASEPWSDVERGDAHERSSHHSAATAATATATATAIRRLRESRHRDPTQLHDSCDEQHPVCKNCQKSKRECLGYDPIFKQQQQPSTNIQPAPTSAGGTHPAPPVAIPSNGSQLPASSSSLTTTSATYGSLPSVLPSSYNSGASSSSNTPGNAYEPSHSAPPTTVKNEHFEYGTAIDPALDSVGAPPSTSTPHLPTVKSVAPIASPFPQRPPNSTLNLRGGGSFFASDPAPQHVSPFQHWTPAYSDYSAKKMRVGELVSWGRPPPPKLKSFPDQAKLDEIRGLYDEIYAPGLEGFFETRWYREESTSNRLTTTSDSVVEMLAGFLSVVDKADQNSNVAMAESANLEFRVVWELACLALTNESKVNPPSVIPPDNDPTEIRNRIIVFDALLSGTVMGDNPLVRPPPTGDYHRVRELDFWYHLGEFCRVEPLGYPPNLDILSQRDQILNRIRTLLDGRENRDVLYSIAIMRALSPDFPADFESTLPQHLDESDPKSKLAVARKFVQDEAKVTGGTTNIVRRFSELAAMAFINPGTNVAPRK
ncbi:negative acting factor [Seiridium cupressi]